MGKDLRQSFLYEMVEIEIREGIGSSPINSIKI